MVTISFNVAYATTLEGVLPLTPNTTIYAEDLGLCQDCIDITTSCFACLQTSQQVFSDESLTSPVSDGYYLTYYNGDSLPAVWSIVGGYPLESGFYNGREEE
jgi:hypothetical protein